MLGQGRKICLQLETRNALDDVFRVAELMQSAISGLSFDQFLQNWEKQSAAERQFRFVVEALMRIGNHEPSVFEQTTDSVAIVGIRNLLVHGHDVAYTAAIFEF